MRGDPPDLLDVIDVNDDCAQQLRDTKSAVSRGNRELTKINSLVQNCAESEPKKALDVIDELVRNNTVLASQIRQSLRSISKAVPSLARTFFDKVVDNDEHSQAYLSDYVAHLFWHDRNGFKTYLEKWYSSHPRFFELAVEQVIDQYYQERRTGGQLHGREEDPLE